MSDFQVYPGIRLHYFREERFKNDYLSVNFLLPPSVYDPAHAALLAPVLRLGTKKHPDFASLNRAAEEAYDASLAIKPYRKYGVSVQPFSIVYLNERFLPINEKVRESAFDLLFEVMLDPLVKRGAFKKEIVDNERKNLIDAMKAEKNNKPRYALRQCLKMLCPDDFFAHSDAEKFAELRRVTPTSLYRYYKDVINKSTIEIFYFGSTDEEIIKAELSARLAPLFGDRTPFSVSCVKNHSETFVEKSERTDAAQSVLVMGYRTDILPDSSLYPAQLLFKELLADAPTSLLFMNVREKESLCYFCSSYAEPASGLFLLYSGIDRKNRSITENAIARQITAVKKGEFSLEQLEGARKSKIGTLREIADSPGYTESWQISSLLIGKKQSPEEMIDLLMHVRKEDIMEVASHLSPACTFFLEGTQRNRYA